MKIVTRTCSLLLIAIAVASITLQAQASWAWAKSGISLSSDYGTGITADTNGNIYTIGSWQTTSLVFDTVTIYNSSGNRNFFLVKHNVAGNVLWGRCATGASNCLGSAVGVDSLGNVYITGNFSGNLLVGTTMLTNTDQFGNTSDIFIAKYDSDGNFLWAKNVQGADTEAPKDMQVDAAGNCFIIGEFKSASLLFGSIQVNNSDGTGSTQDIFIAQYDANGNPVWAKAEGEAGNERGEAINVDPYGSVLITGYFSGAYILFGTDSLFNSGSANDIFIVKYDGGGTQLWAKGDGGSGASECVESIGTDPEGAVVIAGRFSGLTATFGTAQLTNTNFTGNYDDIFVARYDADGNFLWANSAGGSNGGDHANSVSSDQLGNVFITGGIGSTTAVFGSTTLTNAGNNNTYDIFLAKYDSTGVLSWVKGVGGTDDDIGFGLTTDRFNTCTVTGYFQSTPTVFGSDSLFNASGSFVLSDVFIAHLEDPTAIAPDAEINSMISVTPNPSGDGKFIVRTDLRECFLTIYSISGTAIFSTSINNPEFEVDISGQPSGMYTVFISSSSQVAVTRIVKLN